MNDDILKPPDFIKSLNADIAKANVGITHDEFVTGIQNRTMGFKVIQGDSCQLIKGFDKVFFNVLVMLYTIAPLLIIPFWAYHEQHWWLLIGIVVASLISPQLEQIKPYNHRSIVSLCYRRILALWGNSFLLHLFLLVRILGLHVFPNGGGRAEGIRNTIAQKESRTVLRSGCPEQNNDHPHWWLKIFGRPSRIAPARFRRRCAAAYVSLRRDQSAFAFVSAVTSRTPFQSARGLAHSKTLRAFRMSSHRAPASWTAVASGARHRFGERIGQSNASRHPKAPSPLPLCRRTPKRFATSVYCVSA
jgi:hypothetical protein